jgi:CAAX protease family protein
MSSVQDFGPPVGHSFSTPRRGWYYDPYREAPWRWWDGQQWTAYLQNQQGVVWLVGSGFSGSSEAIGPAIRGGGIAAIGAGVGFVGSALTLLVYALVTGGHPHVATPWLILGSQIALWTGVLGAVFVASRRNGSGKLATDYGLGWRGPKDLCVGIAGGLAGGVVPIGLAVLAVWAASGFKSAGGTAPKIAGAVPQGTAGWVILILIATVGAPVIEELFFRGLIQGAFARRIGATSAIFVTALLFCGAHVLNEGPLAPLVLFPPALVLGYLRAHTGKLVPGMVAHATFNALTVGVLLIPAWR